ncbi:Crp/Fnr family transcriptional regulator [Anaerobacillus sp. MEB173]|uniref:Crp/Fnr family transcriptional regulator n=1 Tax=Anaerobacillus sp. MEB173 TaxID=3383345 RepID=UPI003F925913
MLVKDIVGQIPLFKGLSEDTTMALNDIVKVKTVRKGEVLFQDYDKASAIFFINKGKVRLSKCTSDGKEITLGIRMSGQMFAEVALFAKSEMTYPATATILEQGSVSYIQNEDLEKFISNRPDLAMEIFRVMADRLRAAQTTLRDVVLYGNLGSLASTLLRLAKEYGEQTSTGVKINLKLTNQDLGNFFGATRESVNRMISNLKGKDILSVNKGYITIHEVDELKSFLS